MRKLVALICNIIVVVVKIVILHGRTVATIPYLAGITE